MMVPDSPDVEAVTGGDDGIFAMDDLHRHLFSVRASANPCAASAARRAAAGPSTSTLFPAALFPTALSTTAMLPSTTDDFRRGHRPQGQRRSGTSRTRPAAGAG